jgi:hypothetical protein
LGRALVSAHANGLRVLLLEHGELGELAKHVEDVLLRIGGWDEGVLKFGDQAASIREAALFRQGEPVDYLVDAKDVGS